MWTIVKGNQPIIFHLTFLLICLYKQVPFLDLFTSIFLSTFENLSHFTFLVIPNLIEPNQNRSGPDVLLFASTFLSSPVFFLFLVHTDFMTSDVYKTPYKFTSLGIHAYISVWLYLRIEAKKLSKIWFVFLLVIESMRKMKIFRLDLEFHFVFLPKS